MKMLQDHFNNLTDLYCPSLAYVQYIALKVGARIKNTGHWWHNTAREKPQYSQKILNLQLTQMVYRTQRFNAADPKSPSGHDHQPIQAMSHPHKPPA
jgi:hypothetical protein